ncbi:MAG: hypothetical protein IPI51_15700 [Betaproteobacteria bacterium]|nr:hypothetical protein [Betaproteobacteria bacterium]
MLEQAITRRLAGLGEDERLVDQRRQVVEHGPGVDLRVGADLLRGAEAEAAGEHAQAAQHRLLVGPGAARGSIAGASRKVCCRLGAPRAPPVSRRRRSPRRSRTPCTPSVGTAPGQFQGERQAVEVAADVDHGVVMGRRERETGVGRAHAADEQIDRG